MREDLLSLVKSTIGEVVQHIECESKMNEELIIAQLNQAMELINILEKGNA